MVETEQKTAARIQQETVIGTQLEKVAETKEKTVARIQHETVIGT